MSTYFYFDIISSVNSLSLLPNYIVTILELDKIWSLIIDNVKIENKNGLNLLLGSYFGKMINGRWKAKTNTLPQLEMRLTNHAT